MYRITLTAGAMFDATGNLIPPEVLHPALDAIRTALAKSVGGYTEADTFGGWIKDGKLVQEPGKRWTLLADNDTSAGALAQLVGHELHQNAVALEVEPLAVARIVETADA